MKSFPEWFKELCSDVRWFEYTSMNHKGKNFKKAAEFVYAQLLADSRLQMREMSENRKHVYNKLGSMPFDFVAPSLQQEEKKEDKEWVPVSWEKRAEYLNKVQEIIKGSTMANAAPRMSYKEIADSGDVLPPKPKPYPQTSPEEFYVRKRHLEYIKANYEPRSGHPLPSWVPESEWNITYDNENQQ